MMDGDLYYHYYSQPQRPDGTRIRVVLRTSWLAASSAACRPGPVVGPRWEDEGMIHDPLCDWRPCTCPLDYDVPERGHMIGCPEDDCECEIIAKARSDEQEKAAQRVESCANKFKARDFNDAVDACVAAVRGES